MIMMMMMMMVMIKMKVVIAVIEVLMTTTTIKKKMDMAFGGDVAQSVERRTGTPLTQVRFPGAARDFFPRASFLCRLSYGVRTALVCNRMH